MLRICNFANGNNFFSFFIIDYELLFYLGKIGFYIHLGFWGLIILSCILVSICLCCDLKYDDKKDNNYNNIK